MAPESTVIPIPIPPIVPTGITATIDKSQSLVVAWQSLNGELALTKHFDGVWDPTIPLQVKPVNDSSLASISWRDEVSVPLVCTVPHLMYWQIRIYYMDQNYVVQEWGYKHSKWYQGEIGRLGAKATPGSGLAAVTYGEKANDTGSDGDHIRVYYQGRGRLNHHIHPLNCPTDAKTNDIKELAYDNGSGWSHGGLNISNVLAGSRIAGVSLPWGGGSYLRLYFQDWDLYLREWAWNGKTWIQGQPIGSDITSPIRF